MECKLYYKLLEILHKQQKVIAKQGDLLASLVNENMEKENIINELFREHLQ